MRWRGAAIAVVCAGLGIGVYWIFFRPSPSSSETPQSVPAGTTPVPASVRTPSEPGFNPVDETFPAVTNGLSASELAKQVAGAPTYPLVAEPLPAGIEP